MCDAPPLTKHFSFRGGRDSGRAVRKRGSGSKTVVFTIGVFCGKGRVAILYIYVYIVQNILRSGHSYEDSVETSLLKASRPFHIRRLILSFLKRVGAIELKRKSVRTSSLYRLDSNHTKSTFYIVSDKTKWTVLERYDE